MTVADLQKNGTTVADLQKILRDVDEAAVAKVVGAHTFPDPPGAQELGTVVGACDGGGASGRAVPRRPRPEPLGVEVT